MLVAQAVKASEIFLHTDYEERVIEEEYRRLRNSRSNIVLIGMPSCGKSTIGRRLSLDLSLPFLDLDEEIVKDIGMPISDYFASFGEASFRDKESEVIKRLYQSSPMVIATGGGAILRPENVNRLKQNGALYFLDRKLEMLNASKDRPLSRNAKSLQNLYEIRFPLYAKAADRVIANNGSLKEAISLIKEEIEK